MGFVGRAHLEALRRLGVPVQGVLDNALDRLRSGCDAFPLPRAYETFEELARGSFRPGRSRLYTKLSGFFAEDMFASTQQLAGLLEMQVRLVHGSFLQDWLLFPTDWNWRLDSKLGSNLRAVADIGTDWLDSCHLDHGQPS